MCDRLVVQDSVGFGPSIFKLSPKLAVCCLHTASLNVFQQRVVQGRTRLGCPSQFRGWDTLAVPGRLHVGGVRRAVIAEHFGRPVIPSRPINPTSTSLPPG
jgi:hypothetical protein